MISAGRLTVNGSTATLGETVSPDDRILLDGERVSLPREHTHLALNKPAGYLTALRDDRGRPTISDLLPYIPGFVHAGRLDADTSGLVILTTDGSLANRITHPSEEMEKEYRLTVRNPAPDGVLTALASGPTLDDGPMNPPEITAINRSRTQTTFHLTIHEGRKRIIRRSCGAVGLSLLSLERVRVGPVELGDLSSGDYRPLADRELEGLG